MPSMVTCRYGVAHEGPIFNDDARGSSVHVLSVGRDDLFNLLHGTKVEEMRGAVNFVVELLGVGQLELIPHVGRVPHT